MVPITLSKQKLIGLAALLGSAVVGGAILPTLIREGTQLFHPFVFNWFRSSLGLLIMLPLFFANSSIASLKKVPVLNIMLILGIALGLTVSLFSLGLEHTTIIASQLIYTLVPVVVSVIAFFLLGEKLTHAKILGIGLASVGIFILIIFSSLNQERLSLGSLYGNLLIFIAMVGYSSYIAFSKKYITQLSAISIVTLTNASLSLFLLPLAIWAIYFTDRAIYFTPWSVLVLFLIALGGIALVGLVQFALKFLSAGTTSLGTLLAPEFAAITGIFLYGEKISVMLIFSLILTITGVFVCISGEKRTWKEKITQLPLLLKALVRKYV